MAVLRVFTIDPDAVMFSWLPYSHIYARTVDHYLVIVAGSTLALAESPETVVQNLMETWPTHMSSVPRLYEKIWPLVAGPDPTVTAKKLHGIFGPRIEFLGSGGLAPNDGANAPKVIAAQHWRVVKHRADLNILPTRIAQHFTGSPDGEGPRLEHAHRRCAVAQVRIPPHHG